MGTEARTSHGLANPRHLPGDFRNYFVTEQLEFPAALVQLP
jgi:hypothetical protein